jgi:hypothetical protein
VEPSRGEGAELGVGAQRERCGLRDNSDDAEGRWDGRLAIRRRGECQSDTSMVELCRAVARGRSAVAGWTSGFHWGVRASGCEC